MKHVNPKLVLPFALGLRYDWSSRRRIRHPQPAGVAPPGVGTIERGLPRRTPFELDRRRSSAIAIGFARFVRSRNLERQQILKRNRYLQDFECAREDSNLRPAD